MSERFDASWLAMREPVDHRSRAAAAVSLVAARWREGGWSRVVDLGAGTGSNLRYLSPALPGPQQWTLVDHDADLLDRVAAPATAGNVHAVVGDLADAGLAAITERGAQLVTGAALLDLVSAAWLERLITACRAVGAAAHFALTYDGTIEWPASVPDDPPAPRADGDDLWIRQMVNTDQRRDKGLGPALGPMASLTAETRFRAAGYRVWLLQSPWRLGPDDATLAQALVDGWETAALRQVEPTAGDASTVGDADRVRVWAARRRADLAAGRVGLRVGHLDLVALPAAPS